MHPQPTTGMGPKQPSVGPKKLRRMQRLENVPLDVSGATKASVTAELALSKDISNKHKRRTLTSVKELRCPE